MPTPEPDSDPPGSQAHTLTVCLVRLVVNWCWGASGRGTAAGWQIVATRAVPDVTVGANQVLGGAVDAEARERLPVEVVQGAGRDLAGQVVHGQRVGVAVAQRGELAGVPVAERPHSSRWKPGATSAWPSQHSWPARLMGASGSRSPAFYRADRRRRQCRRPVHLLGHPSGGTARSWADWAPLRAGRRGRDLPAARGQDRPCLEP
jgi:hypothetical protein